MSLTRTALIDDDGSRTTGTIFNNAWLTAEYDLLDARWSEATTTATGTQNNLAFTEADTIRANNATALTITGLVAPASPAKPGKPLRIVAIGAGSVTLTNQDTGSTAANRIVTSTGAALSLAAGTGSAILVYDATTGRWRVLASSALGAAPVIQTTTSTGTQNDFALTANATLLRANNATALTLTGLTAGTDGQRLEIVAVGAGGVTLTDQAAGSTAANRIITGVGGPLSLWAGAGTVKLTYDATTARWIATSFPGVGQLRCSAFHSTTQSLTTGVVAACALDSESFDVGALHDTVTNNSRFTIPAGGDGVYVAIGSVYFAGSGAGTGRFLYLAVNGAQVEVVGWPPNANNIRPQIVGTLSLVAGDYLQLWAYQDSGGALNIGAASPNQTRLSVIKVG